MIVLLNALAALIPPGPGIAAFADVSAANHSAPINIPVTITARMMLLPR